MENKDITEIDEHEKVVEQIKIYESGRIDECDMSFVFEQLMEMANSEKREVTSRMRVLFSHLLKWKFLPEKRTTSWKQSIMEQRRILEDIFSISTSLENYAKSKFLITYARAKMTASDETGMPSSEFPNHPEFTIEQALDTSYWPE